MALEKQRDVAENLHQKGNQKGLRNFLKDLSWNQKFKLSQMNGNMIGKAMENFTKNEFQAGFDKLEKHEKNKLFQNEKKPVLKSKMYISIHC